MAQNAAPGATGGRWRGTASFSGPTPDVPRPVGGQRGRGDGALPPALFAATSVLGGPVLSQSVAIGSVIDVAAHTRNQRLVLGADVRPR
jgi:hypothetical protein